MNIRAVLDMRMRFTITQKASIRLCLIKMQYSIFFLFMEKRIRTVMQSLTNLSVRNRFYLKRHTADIKLNISALREVNGFYCRLRNYCVSEVYHVII